METSATRECPSLIHTFFLTDTIGGVFLNPEDKALYDDILRLQGLGSNTPTIHSTSNRAANCEIPKQVNPHQENMMNDDIDMIDIVSDGQPVMCVFHSLRAVDNGEKLYMGNFATADIKGEENVILKMTSEKDFKLTNVLYVLEIHKNLVSGWLLNKFGFHLVFKSDKLVLSMNQMNVENEPMSYRKAVTSSEGQRWGEAIKSEKDSILQNYTWELVDLPYGCKPLGYKWIFKKKMKVDGTIDKYKARLVIKGFRQREGTRPDLAYVVSRLSRYTSNPSYAHWKAITRVLQYLRYSYDYGLHYDRHPTLIEGNSDANWISDIQDSRSTSGYLFTLRRAAIS
nr:Ty1-copia retrotransposon protein [Tanacetum cinerariifolium]